MNFHKTIGYLAALLLMLGIGVPDSFAQDVSKIELSVSPRTLRDSTTTVVTVTATVKVTLDGAVTVAAGQDVSVDIEGTEDDSYDLGANTSLTVTVPEGQSSKTEKFPITFTFETGPPQGDDDDDDEKITMNATSGTVSVEEDDRPVITITDHAASLTRDAQSIRGFRVAITAPAANAWASTGKDKIKVQVLRKGGLAKEFGNFSSIKVSLFNDTDPDADPGVADVELYSLEITDAVQLGSLVIPRIRTAELTGVPEAVESGRAINATNTKAFYTRRSTGTGYDKLEFRFHLNNGGAAAENVYAVATFGLTGAPGDTESMIDNRDEKTSIFPQSPSGFDKVGNGRIIKIDAGVPANDIVSAVSITIDGEAVDNDGTIAADQLDVYAGIGDKIKISATLTDFNETTLGFQIIGREVKAFDDDGNPVDVTGANQVISGFSKTFNALTTLGAVSQGKPVEHELTVTANKFKRKANLADHPDDVFEKNGLYEDDNVVVRVRAFVKDRAGNSGNQAALSPAFILDSRPPKVTITYPKPSGTDSTRFTAAATREFEFIGSGSDIATLKPLNFKNDEATSQNYVIIGTDTLIVAGVEAPISEIEDGGGYDLTDATTYGLKNEMTDADPPKENKRPEEDSAQGGAAVKLQVVSFDLAGNKGTGTPDGGDAIFDAKDPNVTIGFPTNAALTELDNKIGGAEQTQHPVFSIDEATDSILVRYEGGGAVLSVAGTAADEGKVDKNIQVKFLGDNALTQSESYSLQVYARDITGNVGVSDPELSTDFVFDNNLQNPSAGGFKVVSEVRDNTLDKKVQTNTDDVTAYAEMDSVVAGQPLRLTITAIDAMLEDRTAITYAKDGVKVVTMDSGGNMVASVNYWGDGVTDNGDGSATLNGAGWSIGSRMVFLNSETAGGPYNVVVKDLTTDGTLNFKGEKEGITVDAADFAKFKITASVSGVEGVTEVWEDFDLLVEPTDEFGNRSLKTFFDQTPGTKEADSLNILDTRLGNDGNSAKKYGEVNVRFSGQLLEDLAPTWPVDGDGESFSVRALDRPGRTARIRADVDNTFLDEDDARSRNKSGSLALTISEPSEPLDVSITLWGPNGENWTDETELTIPAGGEVAVTFRAEGFNEDDMVTFTVDGEAQDAVAADAGGNAGQSVTLSGSGTVTVKAASGSNMDEVSYAYAEAPPEPMRVRYANAEGEPVYLISDTDMEVGVDDFLAFVAAYGSSEGDENYNLQADVDDDGDVDLQDYLEFISSYGSTAVGPSTKPLVLLPGINENAEFSLSLGSERVIAGELVAVDVSLANVEALMGYGFALNYETDKFEFVSVAPADEDLLKSTGGETLFHHIVADGQVTVANGVYNGTAISGGGDVVRFVFRVLYEFEDNARFEIADGLVFDPSQLQNPALVAGVLELQSTPREFALHQNFPNPFNPDTTIKYDLAESADITLQIYNVLGQVVRTLVVSEAQNAGRYQIRWNGMDDRGVPVSSGVYFYRISADGKFQNVRKLMLLK